MKKVLSIVLLSILLMSSTVLAETAKQTVTLSFAGDTTLGSDDKYNLDFHQVYNKVKSDKYFFSNVKEILANDDLTIVNLEGTLTTSKAKTQKKFAFKGYPKYVNILKEGSIEVVNLSNNHTMDYGKQGFDDTVKLLKYNNIGYYGEGYKYITNIKGLKIAFLGYKGWNKGIATQVKKDIQSIRNKVDYIVVTYHWGDEHTYTPNSTQKYLAHYSIDNGADLVIGHHPHVLQGIEEYKGKYIAYSLGNFCFGGNRNPRDKDTMIFQVRISLTEEGKIDKVDKNVVPCSISSVKNRNDYRPTILKGYDYKRVLDKISKLSKLK